MAYKRVIELFPHEKEELYLLYIDGDVIETTEEHPFWNEILKQWIPVHDLKIGDELTTKDGNQIVIRDIIVKKGITKVFNFEVEDFHTYFVGKNDVWTHNKCGTLHKTEDVFNNGTVFGKTLKNNTQKTGKNQQSQNVYKITDNVKECGLKKGDQIYLDNVHKDHMEVFDKRGNFKMVINLDGSMNTKKNKSRIETR